MDRRVTAPDAGFTLLEMVIVVAVMAILSITAVFSVGRGGDVAQSDAQRFNAAYDRLRDAAILSGAPRAMAIGAQGWQALALPSDEAIQDPWSPMGKVQKFRAEVRFQGRAGPITGSLVGAETPSADLVFLPDGQVTPFEASFIAADRVTRCAGLAWGGLRCEDA